MNQTVPNVLLLSASVALAAFQTAAGELPKEQPKFITIERESVKAGQAAAHAKHEQGWPAAFTKAKSPDYYLAFTSMTGPNEAWYVIPWKSHAALGQSMKRDAKDKELGKKLDKLASKDADFISAVNTIHAMGRPELSVGKFPDLALERYLEVMIFKMRPGSENLFVEGAKAYGAAAKRANPEVSYRVYEVLAGASSPTFVIFSSVKDFGEFDQNQAAGEATWKGATDAEKQALQKCNSEGITEMVVNRYRLDPNQSYVPQEVRDKDPEFWKAK